MIEPYSYDCPVCDGEVLIEIEDHWTDLIGWKGVCPHCATPLEMESETDIEDSMYFWLRVDTEAKDKGDETAELNSV